MSYKIIYDWELNFRKKATLNPKSNNKKETMKIKEKTNSLGLVDNDFKDFMKKWKEKNF
ncbi:MAG: hypothetical protein ACTSPS_12320 [Promethearchaeota archaeon]